MAHFPTDKHARRIVAGGRFFWDTIPFLISVMPGLDPGIHRAAGTMDPRIKAAGNEGGEGKVQTRVKQ
jgi:hypothetical protein